LGSVPVRMAYTASHGQAELHSRDPLHVIEKLRSSLEKPIRGLYQERRGGKSFWTFKWKQTQYQKGQMRSDILVYKLRLTF
jgi:hypothetical protein